jgi:3-deoxy-8-phosphooctulonate synthase
VGDLVIGNDRPLTLIAGPCALESRGDALETSHALVEITAKLGMGFIYKTSFDKANRTSLASGRGIGLRKGLPILAEIRETWGCPVLTDVHEPSQCTPVAEAASVLQISAFLCRQTDLLVAAAKTGRAINVKKGQFLAPWDMKSVAAKLFESENDHVLLCERGASFGYNTLVADMRSLRIMADETGCPIRLRCDPFGPATGRARHDERRSARVRSRSGAGRRRHWRRRDFHGDASRSRPRAIRRSEHTTPQGYASPARGADLPWTGWQKAVLSDRLMHREAPVADDQTESRPSNVARRPERLGAGTPTQSTGEAGLARPVG